MQSQLGAFAICAGVFVYAFLRKRKRFPAIKDLPGPENPSWIFGTSLGGQSRPFHFLKWVGNIECEISKDISGISWVRNPEEWRRGTSRISGTSFVGMVPLGYVATWIEQTSPFRIRTLGWNYWFCAQEDRLWIADPKALNHILQKSGYLYAKPSSVQERTALLTDRGIIWAQGELFVHIGPSLFLVRPTIPHR